MNDKSVNTGKLEPKLNLKSYYENKIIIMIGTYLLDEIPNLTIK